MLYELNKYTKYVFTYVYACISISTLGFEAG